MNWNFFAPNTCKRIALRTLIKHAYLIRTSKKHLIDELKHLEYVFEKYNNFSKWVMEQLLSEVQSKDSNEFNQYKITKMTLTKQHIY